MNTTPNYYKAKFVIEDFRKATGTFEIIGYVALENGAGYGIERIFCDSKAIIEFHEIYSEIHDEWFQVPSKKTKRSTDEILPVIEEYIGQNTEGFEKPWKELKPTIRSQL